jgi:predicted dehydrogenase
MAAAAKLRWGILGASAIARDAVAPAIRNSKNGVLAAVASRDGARGKAFADRLGIPRLLSSYEALVEDPNIDAIYNPLPNSLHAEWSRKAAAAGKAVLCEKPLTVTAPEAAKLIDDCRKLGRPLMEAFMYRFHPQHRRVRELIEADAIGEVTEVRAHLSADLASPVDPANVRFIPDLGGGVLLDMVCYGVSISRMIFGEAPQRVRGWWQLDEKFGVDMAAAGVLEFSGGRLGLVSGSFVSNGGGFYSVIGRKGVIEVPRGIIPGQGKRVSETLIIVNDPLGRRREEELPAVDQYQLMAEAFADAVIEGKPVPLSNEDSLANMEVIDAFARSARSERPETVLA